MDELAAGVLRDLHEARERREEGFDLPRDKTAMLAEVFERAGLSIARAPTVIGVHD